MEDPNYMRQYMTTTQNFIGEHAEGDKENPAPFHLLDCCINQKVAFEEIYNNTGLNIW